MARDLLSDEIPILFQSSRLITVVRTSMNAIAIASSDVMTKITPKRDTTKSWSILVFMSAFFFFLGAAIRLVR